ncbi:L,D-transpeptidase family protein [Streptomyces sp. DSM 42041]|uniref:L,D-transpeptidase family protein n=1 Tax=Streptomyces hazeniae TaxID=3075538 RepID=A0ABU2NUB2_9ACTN|nr:L,D-transpeptidase family protein [Streptomyces sp. DSM 42041]MDT0380578.1 L,D-transpeptidase family protein [Streptomyces sp. DSM 42041]
MHSTNPRKRPRLRAALLAALTALPLVLAGGAATAAPGDGPMPRGHVPEADLVPGYPLPEKQPYQRGTPDQGSFPPSTAEDGPAGSTAPEGSTRARPTPRTPGAEYAVRSSLIEYVPPGEQIRADEPKPKLPPCTASTGPYQLFVERYLGLEEDGVQSKADCRAIQEWQTKVGIYPNSGFAGPVTWKVMTLRWARAHPEKLRGCPRREGVVACLDLSRQIMWVRDGDRMVYDPVPIRSGKPGYETRTGWHDVYLRVRHEHSTLYDSPMPFSQYFDGGQALHGVYDDLYTGPGSHGCVNLRYEDAERLWQVLGKGDRVYVWGAKPER